LASNCFFRKSPSLFQRSRDFVGIATPIFPPAAGAAEDAGAAEAGAAEDAGAAEEAGAADGFAEDAGAAEDAAGDAVVLLAPQATSENATASTRTNARTFFIFCPP
jgi:hypothetical protein